MTQQFFDSYLEALYLKSKNDTKDGYDEKRITKLTGFDKIEAQNIVLELIEKGLITKN